MANENGTTKHRRTPNRLSSRVRRLLENWIDENIERFRRERFTLETIAAEASEKFNREVRDTNVSGAMKACGIEWGVARSGVSLSEIEEQLSATICSMASLADRLQAESERLDALNARFNIALAFSEHPSTSRKEPNDDK